jgi:hypothetical protein
VTIDKQVEYEARHIPIRTTVSMIWTGGKLEVATVTRCQYCGLILEPKKSKKWRTDCS